MFIRDHVPYRGRGGKPWACSEEVTTQSLRSSGGRQVPFAFSNLKNLKLSMDFTEIHPILFMFTLLRSSHNLENLEMEVMLDVAFGTSLFTLLEGHLVVYN
jgi:hypothetical protein